MNANWREWKLLERLQRAYEWCCGLWPDFDLSDPIQRAYHRYLVRAVTTGVMLLGLFLAMLLMGCPHLQTTYRYSGPKTNGWVASHRKTSANYIGPFGWKSVREGQYARRGCPPVIWIPLSECLWGNNSQ